MSCPLCLKFFCAVGDSLAPVVRLEQACEVELPGQALEHVHKKRRNCRIFRGHKRFAASTRAPACFKNNLTRSLCPLKTPKTTKTHHELLLGVTRSEGCPCFGIRAVTPSATASFTFAWPSRQLPVVALVLAAPTRRQHWRCVGHLNRPHTCLCRA